MLVYVLFYLGQLSNFLSCFGAGLTNFSEPPLEFLLPPHYCGLGAGSIPFSAIAIHVAGQPLLSRRCKKKDSQGVSASEMTYFVSDRALNSTHSPTFHMTVQVRKDR